MESLPNIIAIVSSLTAIILLGILIPRIGGVIGKMFKLISVGIFFSIFVHAGFELATSFGILSETKLMPIMGLLLSIGSIAFIIAGIIGIKSFK